MGDNNSNPDYINAYKNYFDKQIRYENIITSKQHINTNIRLNGVVGYVTNTGVFKRYNKPDGLETSYQILGCPLSGTILDVSDPMFDQYLTNAKVGDIGEKFVIGEDMETGSGCGNAGNIVKVTSLLPDNLREPTFKKCSNVSPGNEVVNANNTPWSFESCKTATVAAGYRFFGISSDKCYAGNNVDDSSNISEQYDKITVLWSSDSTVAVPSDFVGVNETGTSAVNNKAYMTKHGTLEISNGNGDILFSTINKSLRADYDGGINKVGVGYGGQRCGVTNSVLNAKMATKLPSSSTETLHTLDIELNDEFLEIDPNKPRPGPPRCNDIFALRYSCGYLRRGENISNAYGKTIHLNCDDDGGNHNILWMRPNTSPKIGIVQLEASDKIGNLNTRDRRFTELIWDMPVPDSFVDNIRNINQDWIDNNKYSRDFLVMGESLGPDEWISSSDGKLRLIMTKRGNLELQTSYKTNGCESLNNNNLGHNFITSEGNGVFMFLPVKARFIKLRPMKWNSHISLRYDVFVDGEIQSTPEDKRSYSSRYNYDAIGTGHARSTLSSPQAWSAVQNKIGEWTYLDLGSVKNVDGVQIMARKGSHTSQYVTEFKIEYGTDGNQWKDISTNTREGVILYGQNDKHAIYELDFIAKPNQSSLGKVAYIDDNNNAHEYVGDMLNFDGMPAAMLDTRCPAVSNMVNIDSSTYESYKKGDNATLNTPCGSGALFIDDIDRINRVNAIRNDRDREIVRNMRANLVSAYPNLESSNPDSPTVEGFVNSGSQLKPNSEIDDANMRDAIILNKAAVVDYKFWWLIVLYLIIVALIVGNIDSDKTKVKYIGLVTACVVYYYYTSAIEFNILNNTNAMLKLIGTTILAALVIYTINKNLSLSPSPSLSP